MTAEEYRAELELQYSVTELEYQQESGGKNPRIFLLKFVKRY